MKLRYCMRFACGLAVAGVLASTGACNNDDGDPAVKVASTGSNVVSYWDTVAADTINAPAAASDTTQSERLPNLPSTWRRCTWPSMTPPSPLPGRTSPSR